MARNMFRPNCCQIVVTFYCYCLVLYSCLAFRFKAPCEKTSPSRHVSYSVEFQNRCIQRINVDAQLYGLEKKFQMEKIVLSDRSQVEDCGQLANDQQLYVLLKDVTPERSFLRRNGSVIAFTMFLAGFFIVCASNAEIANNFPVLDTRGIQPKSSEGFNVLNSALSGASAGLLRGISRTFTFPLDTIKARQQVAGLKRRMQQQDAADTQNENDVPISTFKLSNFFNGLLPILMVIAPANAAFFCVYDWSNKLILEHPQTINPVIGHLLASAFATLPNNAIRIPAEVVKQRCQVESGTSALQTSISIYKEQNVPGFYTGGQAQLAREIPFNAVQFLIFEWIQNLALPEALFLNSQSLKSAIDGFVAAAAACVVTHPVDTVKTRLMTKSVHPKIPEDMTMLGCGKDIVKTEGLAALYAGLLPRLIFVSLGGAIFFWSNSAVKALFEQIQSQ